MSTTYSNPGSWQPDTYYMEGNSEVTELDFIFLCLGPTGTSGTGCSFPGVIGGLATDNTGQKWRAVQNARVPWQAGHSYTEGNEPNSSTTQYPDQLIVNSDTVLMQCVQSGTSGSVEPTWPDHYWAEGIVDGTVVWEFYSQDYDPDLIIWYPNSLHYLGEVVQGGPAQWVVTTAGTSGSVMPFPNMSNQSVTDGTVVWAVVEAPNLY